LWLPLLLTGREKALRGASYSKASYFGGGQLLHEDTTIIAAHVDTQNQIKAPEELCTAIVHDNFIQAGGAERVAEAIARILPKADLFSTVALPDKLSPYLRARKVKDTFLRYVPGLRKYYRHYFFLFPLAARCLRLNKYDVVITSCCGFAKMVRTRPGAVHICYCHTPTRWIWRFEDYAKREKFSPAAKAVLRAIVEVFRGIDLRASRNPDFFIANSNNVAQRIREFYGRASIVLCPPIDCSRFFVSYSSQDYYLVVSRLVAYKRLDLAIEACEKAGRRLVIIGDGPDRERLKTLAGPNTTLRGRLSDSEVSTELENCRALLFPGEEDFGMTPLEANAAGKPCVAYGSGGALDSVIDGETGVLFSEPTSESLAGALLRVEAIEWKPQRLRDHAELFDTRVFSERFLELLSSLIAAKQRFKE
jgi:glycosyltransferase involved in cell wall biosynthesis